MSRAKNDAMRMGIGGGVGGLKTFHSASTKHKKRLPLRSSPKSVPKPVEQLEKVLESEFLSLYPGKTPHLTEDFLRKHLRPVDPSLSKADKENSARIYAQKDIRKINDFFMASPGQMKNVAAQIHGLGSTSKGNISFDVRARHVKTKNRGTIVPESDTAKKHSYTITVRDDRKAKGRVDNQGNHFHGYKKLAKDTVHRSSPSSSDED